MLKQLKNVIAIDKLTNIEYYLSILIKHKCIRKTKMANFESTATKSPEEQVKDIYRELLESHNLEFDGAPQTTIEGDDSMQILESSFESQIKKTREALKHRGGEGAIHDAMVKRVSVDALAAANNAQPGDVVSLIRPLPTGVNPSIGDVEVASLARISAVDMAAHVVGGIREQNLEGYLRHAKVTIYGSPHNGAPSLVERVIDLPGAVIREVEVVGTGDGSVLDSQVLVTKK